MSRRHAAKKREILPDPRYKDKILAKFINLVMVDGKKSVSERIVYGALDLVTSRTKRDALEAFMEALDNLKPSVEVKSRRVGGATYQVPVEVRPIRAIALAMRWLKESAAKRSEKTMAERMAAEIIEAMNQRGTAFKKKEDTIKMAEANRAFAHFRW